MQIFVVQLFDLQRKILDVVQVFSMAYLFTVILAHSLGGCHSRRGEPPMDKVSSYLKQKPLCDPSKILQAFLNEQKSFFCCWGQAEKK